NKDEKVILSGWINKKRDHGNLLFIDLRDNYGVTQCLIDKSSPYFKELEKLQLESVIRVEGSVVKRSDDTINSELKTGDIEVNINSFEILGHCKELPMPIFSDQEYAEEIRLKYRFLDLRRKKIHENIILRSKVISFIRSEMFKIGFLEFQTPILTSSSPEGARDFLVPSRLNPGKFYALPQAPQQFKQLIMVSGFDKYFQIAPCFRDEDARADRSPGEFYQLDLEMSFVEQEDVFQVVEKLMVDVFKKFSSKKFQGKIINIHPSLLPKYKGLNTHKRAIINKDKFSGCTVHYVTPKLDSGKIIMQKTVKIATKDNSISLAKKVLKKEHKLYPASIMKIFT
ncbi:formyltransferase family protein, partial [Candidatus Pelagibacter sp.]|nr:formyltransferase family protein [Candidatus Pelagibacter sp.]